MVIKNIVSKIEHKILSVLVVTLGGYLLIKGVINILDPYLAGLKTITMLILGVVLLSIGVIYYGAK